MPTDRAFACLLIAALLLCGAARQVVSAIRQQADASASVTRQGSIDGSIEIAPSRAAAQNGVT